MVVAEAQAIAVQQVLEAEAVEVLARLVLSVLQPAGATVATLTSKVLLKEIH
tara:strand:+ start:242 stop:397 length:156 start_codon:yes stop_codon:yes gene_type:complete